MSAQDQLSKPRKFSELAYEFLLGTAFGLVFAMLPAFFISLSTIEWRMSYIVALGLLALLSGLLTVVFGKKFLEPLIFLIESIPPVG